MGLKRTDYEKITSGQVAEMLGVTPERVRQLEPVLHPSRDARGHRRYEPAAVHRLIAQRQAKQAVEGFTTGLMMHAADAFMMRLSEDEQASIRRAYDAAGRQEPYEAYARRVALARLSPNPLDREEQLSDWFLSYLAQRREKDYPCLQVPLPPQWASPIRMLIEFVRAAYDHIKAGEVADASRTLWGARIWSWPLGAALGRVDGDAAQRVGQTHPDPPNDDGEVRGLAGSGGNA
jgi:DNA-binding transcriptional MerR regulator